MSYKYLVCNDLKRSYWFAVSEVNTLMIDFDHKGYRLQQ